MKRKKTVGEILKEEGVIKESEEREKIEEKKEVKEAELFFKIEKLEGKIELQKDLIDKLNDRFSSVSENVGDLRRMIMDREKFFDKLGAEFEKVKNKILGE